MKNYSVKLNHLSNENYHMPTSFLAFTAQATNMEQAIKNALHTLRNQMSHENDYYIVEQSENYGEISFGDADTGQDVSYIITEMRFSEI